MVATTRLWVARRAWARQTGEALEPWSPPPGCGLRGARGHDRRARRWSHGRHHQVVGCEARVGTTDGRGAGAAVATTRLWVARRAWARQTGEALEPRSPPPGCGL